MLKITATPNYNNQMTFSGKFMKSQALSKAMERADIYDLNKFQELLERMSKTNDRRTFELSSFIKDLYGRKLYTVNLTEYKLKADANAIDKAFITMLTDRECPRDAYKDVLSKINGILEKIYPDRKLGNSGENTLIEKIYEHLS